LLIQTHVLDVAFHLKLVEQRQDYPSEVFEPPNKSRQSEHEPKLSMYLSVEQTHLAAESLQEK